MTAFFSPPPPQPRLFAFPHAGGADVEPKKWPNHPRYAVVPVLLPGRGVRRQERPYRAMEPLVEDLADALPTDQPFVFYGHSFGSHMAFELVRELRRRKAPLPQQLIVGARGAPGLPARLPALGNLPQEEFVAKVAERFGGVPDALRKRPDILNLFLAPLRDDIRVLERGKPVHEDPIPVPICALDADDDPSVLREDVAEWARLTTAEFTLQAVTGGHFFHRELNIPALFA